MVISDLSVIKKRTLDAVAAALLGWMMYVIKQGWTPNALIGIIAELFYQLYIYLLMPFAFAGVLLAAIVYAANRVRGCCDRDIISVIPAVAALSLAFYVTAPVIGEIGIVKGTAVFFVLRLIRLFW